MANAKDAVFRFWTGVHQAVFTASRGRVLGKVGPMPVLVLTTTGRRTGKKRTTMLTAPVSEPGRIVLVASYGGDDRHPTWYLNLLDHPDVEVTMEGRTTPMRGRVATADERADLWPRVTRAYRGYAAYQRRTSREIPLVVLEPADPSPG